MIINEYSLPTQPIIRQFAVYIPHVCFPLQNAYNRATVLHKEVLYFGLLINRGSVSVSISSPVRRL